MCDLCLLAKCTLKHKIKECQKLERVKINNKRPKKSKDRKVVRRYLKKTRKNVKKN